MAGRLALIVFCGLSLAAGSNAALIISSPATTGNSFDQDRALYEHDVTLQSVTSAADLGFLMGDLKAMGSCLSAAHCRWIGRAISWWIYDNVSAWVDTTNVLAPGTAPAMRETQWFSGWLPATGIPAFRPRL